jgi:quercetin dioxygenase-like cupin family protein
MTKQLPTVHPKGWGHELWIHNSELYCGKILFFLEGKQCSWHYHLIKDEVFYVQRGTIELTYSNVDDIEMAKSIILHVGDTFHIKAGLRHRMKAIVESEIIEISTTHEESDSYRVIKGD